MLYVAGREAEQSTDVLAFTEVNARGSLGYAGSQNEGVELAWTVSSSFASCVAAGGGMKGVDREHEGQGSRLRTRRRSFATESRKRESPQAKWLIAP